MSHIGQPRWSGEIKSDTLAVGLGKVSGLSHVHKFGLNPAVTTVEEDIWGTAVLAANEGGVNLDYDLLVINV